MVAEPQQGPTLILGRAQARGELVAPVHDELRRVAACLMRRERTDHTPSPTAVVHVAAIRPLGEAAFKAVERSYLFASAARAVQAGGAHRPRGGGRRVPFDAVVDYFERQGLDVVAVHEALDRLAEPACRQAQVMT
jgi:RNA polymerase sigma-70 factor (ECF subfamily)